jgi:C4-dicarboxylate-specific signal transduction histidine kinase
MFRKDTSARLPVDINGLIVTVLAIVRIDLQKNGVELQTQLGERALVVEGDKVQLQQVVLNLVMNAIEAMQSVQPRGVIPARRPRRIGTRQYCYVIRSAPSR